MSMTVRSNWGRIWAGNGGISYHAPSTKSRMGTVPSETWKFAPPRPDFETGGFPPASRRHQHLEPAATRTAIGCLRSRAARTRSRRECSRRRRPSRRAPPPAPRRRSRRRRVTLIEYPLDTCCRQTALREPRGHAPTPNRATSAAATPRVPAVALVWPSSVLMAGTLRLLAGPGSHTSARQRNKTSEAD